MSLDVVVVVSMLLFCFWFGFFLFHLSAVVLRGSPKKQVQQSEERS
jgi:hypothetical protein